MAEPLILLRGTRGEGEWEVVMGCKGVGMRGMRGVGVGVGRGWGCEGMRGGERSVNYTLFIYGTKTANIL